MRIHPKGDYAIFEKKAKEHRLACEYLFKSNAFDACVSTACLSLINYMDALSVNLFGRDNEGRNHEQAPIILFQKLSGIGKSGFKALCAEIHEILNLKNIAAYESRTVSREDAKNAMQTLKKTIEYYNRNVQRLV